MANDKAAPRGIEGSWTPKKITRGRAKLGVMPCTSWGPTIAPTGPKMRYKFDCTRIKSTATAKKPTFFMVRSALRTRLLRCCRPAARLASLGISEDDQDFLEPGEVDGRLCFDRLIDAEIALLDLSDARHRDAARKPTAH